jgi:AraC-like DNA-binding protein
MTIRFFRPELPLAGVVTRYYAHDAGALSMASSRWRIVPDGEVKLIFPYRGGIACSIGDRSRWHPESRLIISGMRDTPGELRFPSGVAAVVAVLRPDALYRLTGIPQREITNRTLDGEELFGALAREWQQRLADAASPEDRLREIEQTLRRLLQRVARSDSTFDHALKRIRRSDGRVRVDRLARELGWSRKRIARAFGERVGLSPKRLSGILRFHTVYNHITRTPVERRDDRLIYDYYFDQSHFLKDFKRYAGITPRSYEPHTDYGRFYIP